MREVSRAHSTPASAGGRGKFQRAEALPPDYVAGFIDGEGCFSVSFGRHKTLRHGVEVRIEFSIELRADDRKILERIRTTIGCGKVFDCNYDRYGWYPHAKYKIGSVREMWEFLIPFLDRHPLQAKKREVYRRFRDIVGMAVRKEHLTNAGLKRIQRLRSEIRVFGKKHRWETARVRENRSPGGVRHS